MRNPWTLRKIYATNRTALTPEELEIARKKNREAVADWRARTRGKRTAKKRLFEAWLKEHPEALSDEEAR